MHWILLAASLTLFQESEEDCKKAVDAFGAAYRNAAEPARIAAISELGKHKCEKAVGILSQLLTGEAEKVRIAAAKALGTYDSAKAVEAAANAVSANLKDHEVLEALAKAIEDIDWEVGATILNPLLRKHDDKDILEALHVIVPVLGKLGSASSVDPLIKLLEHAENEGKGGGRVKGIRSRGNPQLAALKGPVDKALQAITGGTQSSSDKWEEWWKANSDRLAASSTAIYLCRATGKRWVEKAGEAIKCPFHDKPEKDGIQVKIVLREQKK